MKLTEIISNGHWNWRKICEEEIRPLVEKEFEDKLRHAGLLERIYLRWRIAREIYRRVQKMSSPYDLHSHFSGGAGR